jgi:ubiquinone/menaquinone biosynthesis C-methylase UbiE
MSLPDVPNHESNILPVQDAGQIGLERNGRVITRDDNDKKIGSATLEISVTLPPEGWITEYAMANLLGVSEYTIKKLSEPLKTEKLEWFGFYKGHSSNRLAAYLSPELCAYIEQELTKVESVPDGWQNRFTIRKNLNISSDERILRISKEFEIEHPEWIRDYRHPNGNVLPYFSPDAVIYITEAISKRELAPDGWKTKPIVATELGVSLRYINNEVLAIEDEHPEWLRKFDRQRGGSSIHLNQEAVSFIQSKLDAMGFAPSGWHTTADVASLLETSDTHIHSLKRSFIGEHPDWVRDYAIPDTKWLSKSYFSPEAIEFMRNGVIGVEDSPEGWETVHAVADRLNTTMYRVHGIASELAKKHPEWIREYRQADRNHTHAHISPEAIEYITMIIQEHNSLKNSSQELNLERDNLENSFGDFLADLNDMDTMKSKEFTALLSIFGAETALDVLYQQHPEYKKLPIPYVKSKLAEYLGEFLPVRGGFSLEGLEKGAAFLSVPVFKDNLTELIKNDCLRLLNQLTKTSLEDVNITAVIEYIAHIREQSSEFSNPNFEEVLNDVTAYYELLFENIHKPNYLIDQLDGSRLFPDINQRINVQEIAFKHKILIADEMGTGKSASVIMAKEILGVKQALVIVPSNVVAVWENYLSDRVDKDGKQIGYFKEGEAPKLLVVSSINDLTNANPEDYNYVVISQERLNESYTEALGAFNYDMLIVDEMHKLKNLSSGMRSANLIKLAERIGDDKYLALLSGTPVPNKISDIALSLKLLYPEQFKDVDNKQLISQIINGDMLDLRSMLVPRMQMKSLAENIDMPALNEVTESVELSEREKEIYDLLIEEDELTASEKLTVLRQFNLNSRMLDATPDLVGTKVTKVNEALNITFAQKDKVVMFVNDYIENVMRGTDTILVDLNLPGGVEILTIDGSVSKESRLEIQAQLQETGRKMLLIVSGQTADTGVDFSAADEVYHYNEPWSVYDKQQQTARIYRPGLEDDLTVRTFITEGTIERGIHEYIGAKHTTVEKLLRGIPISEIEKNMLRQEEKQADSGIEVNPELAKYYFSAADRMTRIYGHVKELGEKDFRKFLTRYDKEYANSYANLVGSRSYQANVSRLSGSLIKEMSEERGQQTQGITVLDLASGPEMLRRHISDDLADSVTSLDINQEHFKSAEGKTIIGSFTHTPVASSSIDYVNLSLGLHYTSFVPSKNNYERLETLKETNRILRVGGRATIGMIHSLALSDDSTFEETISKLGLKVVREYTGLASAGKNFQTQVITLEKVADCTNSTQELVREIGPIGLKSLKFKKVSSSLVDSRKIIKRFLLGERAINVRFNETDKNVLDEEEHLIAEMENMKAYYKDIENIPKSEVLARGFSRIFNGKRYVLFKRLTTDTGAVAIR